MLIKRMLIKKTACSKKDFTTHDTVHENRDLWVSLQLYAKINKFYFNMPNIFGWNMEMGELFIQTKKLRST